jgi:hypothetical protein
VQIVSRGRYMGMTQQPLYHCDFNAGFQQVSRKAVA